MFCSQAHQNVEDAILLLAQGPLEGANINRSPTSYLLNPQDERDSYPEGDTDKNMLLLEIMSRKSKLPIGSYN